MATTPRWGIPYPVLASAADVPQWMHDLAVSLDDVAKDDQGLASARPAAGNRGKWYYETDLAKLLRDNGTSWQEVMLGRFAFGAYQNPNTYGLSSSFQYDVPHTLKDKDGAALVPTTVVAFASTGVTTGSSTDIIHVSVVQGSITNAKFTVKGRSDSGGTMNFPGIYIYWAAIA